MSAKILEISASDDDQRLDRWLRRSYPQLTQGRIEKMCRKGELRIDGSRCKASSRLKVGQAVRIPPLTNLEARSPKLSKPPNADDAKSIMNMVIQIQQLYPYPSLRFYHSLLL